MKFNITAPMASQFVENNNFDFNSWNNDCLGEFENCCFIDLLYSSENNETNEENHDNLYQDFNPFEDEDDEIAEKESEPKPEEDLVFVKVVGVENVYSVKVDALVYANNQMLIIDDEELNHRSYDRIQNELNQIAPPVSMGSVYRTSNGGNHKGGIVPKNIYHAVVATQTRLVNEGAITKSTIKALTQADEDGCSSIAILPLDCGNFDLHQTANAQLSAIYNFLETVPTKNIKNIFIITTKSDKVTLDIFNEKFDRIFGD
jgi:O-acetyl-ADP-ribose deacetylase (regulator of RNase III)